MDDEVNFCTLLREAEVIATILEIAAPSAETSTTELMIWCAWWRASVETARRLTPADRTRLKAGGWWPLETAEHVRALAPEIVRRPTRPSPFRDPLWTIRA